jgi:hypothetical protein
LQEEEMVTIVVKDLSENLELDRKAMQAIMGGSRFRSAVGSPGTQPGGGQRIVDLRAGAAHEGAGAAQAASNKPAK